MISSWGGMSPPKDLNMVKPIERVLHSGLFGPWDRPNIKGILPDELPPAINPARQKSWGTDSFEFFPNFTLLFWAPGWYLTYHYWPTAVDKHIFEGTLYFVPPTNTRQRLAQELAAVTFKEYAFQDANTLEATQTMINTKVVTDFPLCDQEILLRHLHKTAGDYVNEYKKQKENTMEKPVSKLPSEFADLEPFTDWCLATEQERYDKRLASTMAEMQEFYDAAFGRLEDAIVYLDARFPLNEMPDDAKASDASDAVAGHGVVPDRGLEATARARQRRHVHRARQGAGGLTVLTLKAAGLVDVDAGEIVRPGIVRVEDDRIVGIGGEAHSGIVGSADEGEIIDLGESILLPGLMDMEVNLLMGGRGENPGLSQVQDDPPTRVLRAVGNSRRTLRAGFTTVRNLGLFVKTGGYLLDVALGKAIDAGWIEGPRVVPAGHAITPTGGHLDPTMFAAFMPGVLELTVEEGIANGVDEIRKAVRYQIKHGAQLIKVCCSGGVMSLTGEAGAQHYSDEELRAIVDEAHRRGLRVAAHTHGAEAVKHAVECGIDCIEHGFLMDDEAIKMLVDNDRFLVTTRRLAEAMDVSRAPKELQDKAAEMFPKARTSIKAAYEAGVKIAVGTDAPAIPHGKNADELVTLVEWGMPPAAVLRAATVVAADLINKPDLGRIAEGYLADVIAVPGDPLADITVTQSVNFVMKGGKVFRHDTVNAN